MKTYDSADLFRGVKAGLTLLVAVNLLSGCRTPGYMKSDTAAWHFQATVTEVKAEGSNLEATVAALNDLVKTPAGDLRVQFHRFGGSLDQLVASAGRAAAHAPTLKRRSAAYFETWDHELAAMSDEQIRKTSAARKIEVSSQCEASIARLERSQSALSPLIAYLEDIRRALSTDLTPAGLHAAASPAVTASEKAAQAQTDLAQTASDLDAMSVKMSSFIPPSQK